MIGLFYNVVHPQRPRVQVGDQRFKQGECLRRVDSFPGFVVSHFFDQRGQEFETIISLHCKASC